MPMGKGPFLFSTFVRRWFDLLHCVHYDWQSLSHCFTQISNHSLEPRQFRKLLISLWRWMFATPRSTLGIGIWNEMECIRRQNTFRFYYMSLITERNDRLYNLNEASVAARITTKHPSIRSRPHSVHLMVNHRALVPSMTQKCAAKRRSWTTNRCTSSHRRRRRERKTRIKWK